MNLDTLKIRRMRVPELQPYGSSLLGFAIRRYRQLSTVYPFYKVWGYFICKIFEKSGFGFNRAISCKLKMKSWLQRKLFEEYECEMTYGFARCDGPDIKRMIFAIMVTGGLGDALIVARLVRDLQMQLKNKFLFDVYFHTPKSIEPFFSNIEGFRGCLYAELFSSSVKYYAFALRANQFVTFVNEHVKYRLLMQEGFDILVLLSHVEMMRKPIDRYITAHPVLDGAFADFAVRNGSARHTFLHEMLGIPYGGNRLDITVDHDLQQRFGLVSGHYITVHDGWDSKFKLVAQRPTKSLPLQTWSQIVELLKSAIPEFKIVQLGGTTGSDIHGVDINLRSMKLSFQESMSILAGAALHLDTESGLVHVGSALGIKSVVMFGPTNMGWFSYSENYNVGPKQCGNCWWSTDSWMDICPVGHEVPVCTASIDPRDVVLSVMKALGKHGDLQCTISEKVITTSEINCVVTKSIISRQ